MAASGNPSLPCNLSPPARLYLLRSEGARQDERTLTTKKANYAAAGGEIPLRWRDGVLTALDEEAGIIGSIKRGTAETIFMECLEAVIREGRNVSESKHSGNYAPKLFADRPEARGYRNEGFRRAMERLFQAGKIRVEDYGRGGDRRQRIIAVQPETGSEGASS